MARRRQNYAIDAIQTRPLTPHERDALVYALTRTILTYPIASDRNALYELQRKLEGNEVRVVIGDGR